MANPFTLAPVIAGLAGVGMAGFVLAGLTHDAIATPSHETAPSYVLLATDWSQRPLPNVYFLDSGLTADDCAHDLEALAPSPMIELEPGKWKEAESVHLSCALQRYSDF